jgi:hypothetical protein
MARSAQKRHEGNSVALTGKEARPAVGSLVAEIARQDDRIESAPELRAKGCKRVDAGALPLQKGISTVRSPPRLR